MEQKLTIIRIVTALSRTYEKLPNYFKSMGKTNGDSLWKLPIHWHIESPWSRKLERVEKLMFSVGDFLGTHQTFQLDDPFIQLVED